MALACFDPHASFQTLGFLFFPSLALACVDPRTSFQVFGFLSSLRQLSSIRLPFLSIVGVLTPPFKSSASFKYTASISFLPVRLLASILTPPSKASASLKASFSVFFPSSFDPWAFLRFLGFQFCFIFARHLWLSLGSNFASFSHSSLAFLCFQFWFSFAFIIWLQFLPLLCICLL